MKLSISNIIWEKGKENFEDFLKAIVENNVFSVELSLNSIFEEPLEMSKNDFIWLKTLLKKYNVSISSLHSLTFTRPDLEIFNTIEKKEELLFYLLSYIGIARELNTKNIVYGSPKSRQLYKLTNVEANEIFRNFLNEIDKYSEGINFNIEPLPKLYCDYLNTFEETVYLLKNENLNNIFIQLDIRSIIESDENIEEIFNYKQYIRHVHIGEPNLTMPSNKFEKLHQEINYKLRDIPYENYCAIEVINHKKTNLKTYIKKTIENTRRYYNDKA